MTSAAWILVTAMTVQTETLARCGRYVKIAKVERAVAQELRGRGVIDGVPWDFATTVTRDVQASLPRDFCRGL